MKALNKRDMLRILHGIDRHLTQTQGIVLCGSAAVILQDKNFRATTDIDFTQMPNAEVQMAMRRLLVGSDLSAMIFDTRASGVVQLLYDYEDRLVTISDGFKFLGVKVLSITDWVVSKLDSPKSDDIVTCGFITMQRLAVVEKQMGKYGGLRPQNALTDLRFAREALRKKRK
ncbi:hypothetical protein FACS1894208_00710 [Clostridia bacterium]|nr:hypothetical protein FACS1894208_00710 [Clostridia bacterium]